MDADRFPRDVTIQIRTGGYIVRQLSDCVFLVQNWNPQCPFHKNFTLIGRQYLSDEPMTRERQEAIDALLQVVAKEGGRV